MGFDCAILPFPAEWLALLLLHHLDLAVLAARLATLISRLEQAMDYESGSCGCRLILPIVHLEMDSCG